MRDVQVLPVSLSRLAQLLPPNRAALLDAQAARASRLLEGRIVWNVSSTAQGGGVAEMLNVMVAYGLGAGVETRWLVLSGDEEFFKITKRLHNLLHGSPGDGAGLGPDQLEHYRTVLSENLESWLKRVRPGDIVLLHDPQTAGMTDAVMERGAHVVWRCHIGADHTNEHTDRGWDFLRPLIERADAWVFSRRAYAPAWLTAERVWEIPPSLDPLSPKNAAMAPEDVGVVLRRAGLLDGSGAGRFSFTRRDGGLAKVRAHHGLLVDEDGPLPAGVSVLLQVSRWDRLKDMAGVLEGFAQHLQLFPDDVHLLLAGPDVGGVSDDPEGVQVLRECRDRRAALTRAQRSRVHLCCLPMDDVDENAYLVNALQRGATVVVQKSLVEGFGLTVTEPMWKARPVVASAVGGIVDQIQDGVSGVLVGDPTDLEEFARLAADLCDDPERRARIGAAARERVVDRFLGDRHLVQYGDLFGALVGEPS